MTMPNVGRYLRATILAAVVVGCEASVTASDTNEAPPSDSMSANLGDGPWRASRSLRVSQPGGDLLIEGEDGFSRRLVIRLYGLGNSIVDGASGTIELDEATSHVVGVAFFTTGASEAWTTSGSGGAGTIRYSRAGRTLTATFQLVLAPVPGSQAVTSRSVTNGRFEITLP